MGFTRKTLDLCDYLSSGPIIVMCLEKENAVLDNRTLMGATNPKEAKDGTFFSTSVLTITSYEGQLLPSKSQYSCDSLQMCLLDL